MIRPKQTQEFSNDEYKQILPASMAYIILNHLHLFNDKPEKIRAINDKFEKLKDPFYSVPLQNMYEVFKIVLDEYYEQMKKFPDIKWIGVRLPAFTVKEREGNYSEDIYESFLNYLSKELTKRKIQRIIDKEDLIGEDYDSISKIAIEERSRNIRDIKRLTADDIENLYDESGKEPPGVPTLIEELDEHIIALPNSAISLVNAPAGQGKTTLAASIMYNAAVVQGLHVIYVAYEAQEQEMWFNLCARESLELGLDVSARDFKYEKNNPDLSKAYKMCHGSIRKKLNERGGYINILTTNTLGDGSTFEEFCYRLERESEIKEKKASLIVIDNVDNLSQYQVGKSYERDHMSAMNSKIKYLDHTFTKKYHNGEGTHVLLLSQTNREGIEKLDDNEDNFDPYVKKKGKKKATIDYRVISDYSSLYHKAKIVLVCSSSTDARLNKMMKIYIVKNRDNPPKTDPVRVFVDYAHGKVGGEKAVFASLEGFNQHKKESVEAKEILKEHPDDDDFED